MHTTEAEGSRGAGVMRHICGVIGVYVQTKKLERRFSDRPNVRWFPNTRDVCPPAGKRSKTVRRLLFVAQLRLEKGLRETLEACRDLPSSCHLNVFGPQMPHVDVVRMMENHDRATYRGVTEVGGCASCPVRT